MDCRRFEEVQIASLAGEARARNVRRAALHAESCEPCREEAGLDRWLEAAFGVDRRAPEESFRGAHRRLEETLVERRAFCGSIEGPFGPVYLACTERGLCRISFRLSEGEFARELENGALIPEDDARRVAPAAREIRDYFAGRRERFDLPLDLWLATPFQQKVLRATSRIPYGQVRSYGDIARRIGEPEARRAVGGALGRNPIAIVIPCHRVVAADGSIGGYTGGLDIKRTLLRIEGIELPKH